MEHGILLKPQYKFITISTDKAVNPINVMGAIKLLAGRLTISANFYRGKRKIAFYCVRFGNVLDTMGSVVPLFREQIKNGGPLTITDPNMNRFITSIPKAVELVLKLAEMAKGGEIFVLKMPVLRLGDLAEVMIQELAPEYGYAPDEIKIKIIEKRSGEKLYEELMTEDEAKYAIEKDELYVLNLEDSPQQEEGQIRCYSSDSVEKLKKDQIKKLLKETPMI